MKRNVTLEEISDGRLYGENDMVKAGCGDCQGCSACCRGMGDSIVLDPLDICRLSEGLQENFNLLLGEERIELGVVDGLILPHLKMKGEETAEGKCSFLNEEGRCSIHPYRPGICRLFPLGRYYENGDFQYFLQTKECARKDRTKVKVSKWIDAPGLKESHAYINAWHSFLLNCEEMLAENTADESLGRTISTYLLQLFYIRPYTGMEQFYEEFALRLQRAQNDLGWE